MSYQDENGIPELVEATAASPIDRRHLLKLAAATGLSLAAVSGLVSRAMAGGGSSRALLTRNQDASPVPMATPVIGAQADGTTLWKVMVGGMDMENMIEFHGFFPGEITINAGDSIWFAEEMPMFHTVTFPKTGEMPPPIIMPDPEAATPTAGPPTLILNPIMFTGAGDSLTVDGSQLVSTAGDVFSDPSQPWIFTFPTAGTYDYYCTPHASVMHAKVIVQDAGATYPMDQAAYDAKAAEEMEAVHQLGLADIEKYSTPSSTTMDDGSTLWEVALGAGGKSQARVQRILPNPIEVTAGDSIHFVIQSEGEPHTATFIDATTELPADAEEAFADGTPKLVITPDLFFASESSTWSGTGLVNSGYMGIPEAGLPMEWTVKLDTPGDYVVFCALHGAPDGTGMATPVTVKAAG